MKKKIRKVHLWLSLIVILPLVTVSATGLLLMVKKHIEWVQPATQKGSSESFTLSSDQILKACRADARTTITEWSHIERIDIRPNSGIMKIQGPNHIEVQLDATTGSILHIQQRNSDLIESIHDGSFFGTPTKYLLFFVAELFFFIQLITGIYLFVIFLNNRRKNRKP